MFGGMDQNFSFNGVQQSDPRDAEIEMLKAEIAKLKAEIELMQTEVWYFAVQNLLVLLYSEVLFCYMRDCLLLSVANNLAL